MRRFIGIFAAVLALCNPVVTYAADFIWDIADNVPDKEVATIKQGLAIGEAYIGKALGGAIPDDYKAKIIVKIVATGKGNEEEGGGGGVATAFSVTSAYPRLFFDVANVQWSQNNRAGWTIESDNMKSVIHEYTHAWQGWLGAMSIHDQPLGNWINEGLAEYVAYSALADAGRLKKAKADAFELQGALGGELQYKLYELGSTQTPVWPGHAGYVALDWLVAEAPDGLLSLRKVGEEVGKGNYAVDAFQTAFNISMQSFYQQFEPWRTALLKSKKAWKKRPVLVNTGE